MCPGCYKPNVEGYCLNCRKELFDGAKVSHILDFDTPKADNLPVYQEKTKRLSISGVQLKYSLRLEGNRLTLTETGGQYILKPVPPSILIMEPDQAPENEHLTMQLASLFGIKTAANALIYYRDGEPAYLTRRFDVKPEGGKFLQEDMAQLSGRTRKSGGENFKYEGTYEEIGQMIQNYAAAAQPALENYFRLVLFNYLFSNGDAHLKNFSLIETRMGDHTLAPAYDLLCTVLHTPNESDTALDLYKGDVSSTFYSEFGYYGQPNFREFAAKIGLIRQRAGRIIAQLLSKRDEVHSIVNRSLLNADTKQKYLSAYSDKLTRMKMTRDMIAEAMDPEYPNVYTVTTAPTRLSFSDGSFKIGFFDGSNSAKNLEKENKYKFIELSNAREYKSNRNEALITIIDGDQLTDVEYPSTNK